jgi:RNA polymerase sigma-70 factor (ECF subfamily)
LEILSIVNSIKEGDQSIFKQVFIDYHEKLYFYILKKTASTYLAEEVVQLTFIKLWNNRTNLSEEYSISTQLYRIATTTLIDLIRKRNAAELAIKKLVEKETTPLDNASIDNLELKDLSQRLEKAMETLPPTRRKVFKMSRFQEMSYNEIANELSISPKTVENHISMAIKQLRPYLIVILVIITSSLCFTRNLLGVNGMLKRNNQIKVTQLK